MGSVVIVSGPPASGKTTLCRALAAGCPNGVHLESDRFHDFIPHRVDPASEDSHHQNTIIIRAVANAALAYAKGGYTVFLDGVIGPWFLPEFRPVLESEVPTQYVVLKISAAQARVRARERAWAGHEPDRGGDATQVSGARRIRTTRRGCRRKEQGRNRGRSFGGHRVGGVRAGLDEGGNRGRDPGNRGLAALPLGLAFFGEGAGPLLGVLAGEHLSELRPLQFPGVLFGDTPRGADDLFAGRHGEGRVLCDSLGQLQSHGAGLPGFGLGSCADLGPRPGPRTFFINIMQN